MIDRNRAEVPSDQIVRGAENWLLRNLDEISDHVATISLACRRSILPRRRICRFTNWRLDLVICPSV